VSRHVQAGDVIELGGEPITVLYTPGHTPDSVCYLVSGAVLSGDTLLIGGTGRTDFPGGNAGDQYDGITRLLFALPEETMVYPAHDYQGRKSSTIGVERRQNARLAGKSRGEYVHIMDHLNLPLPDRLHQALQVNQSGCGDEEVRFAPIPEVADASPLNVAELEELLAGPNPPLLLDVREPEEFVGELGHIRGALLVPLDALARRLPKLLGYVDRRVVCICRAGARSASASALLRRAGFSRVFNLSEGMLSWIQAGRPVQH
jgi:rhodanese-related sulfurtransferase